MNKETISNDVRVLTHLVDLLVASSQDDDDSFGLRRRSTECRYEGSTTFEHVADVLNEKGIRSARGTQLTANTLRQVIHRLRRNEDLMEQIAETIDWNSSPVQFMEENHEKYSLFI